MVDGYSSGAGAEVTLVDSDCAVDVERERRHTVGATSGHHFNAAGAALSTNSAVEAVVAHLRREQVDGGYDAAKAVAPSIEGLYALAARTVGAEPDEIALFDSASTGLRVIVDALRLGRGDRLLLSRSTYVSHALHLLTLMRECGVQVEVLEVDDDGVTDLEHLTGVLTSRRSGCGRDVICVAHVPTSSGLVEPVAEIGAIARAREATYLLDATQSVGQLPVDVDEIGCHALVTTGRKFLRGPRGTGFTFVHRGLLDSLAPTAPDVRGATWTSALDWTLAPSARRFETWEASIALRLGLRAALEDLHTRGIERTSAHLISKAGAVRDRIGAIPGVRVTDPIRSASAIVTFVVDGLEAETASAALALHGVRTVSVPASHGQWDLGSRGVPAVVRASVHVYNNQADIDALVGAVEHVAGEQR